MGVKCFVTLYVIVLQALRNFSESVLKTWSGFVLLIIPSAALMVVFLSMCMFAFPFIPSI